MALHVLERYRYKYTQAQNEIKLRANYMRDMEEDIHSLNERIKSQEKLLLNVSPEHYRGRRRRRRSSLEAPQQQQQQRDISIESSRSSSSPLRLSRSIPSHRNPDTCTSPNESDNEEDGECVEKEEEEKDEKNEEGEAPALQEQEDASMGEGGGRTGHSGEVARDNEKKSSSSSSSSGKRIDNDESVKNREREEAQSSNRAKTKQEEKAAELVHSQLKIRDTTIESLQSQIGSSSSSSICRYFIKHKWKEQYQITYPISGMNLCENAWIGMCVLWRISSSSLVILSMRISHLLRINVRVCSSPVLKKMCGFWEGDGGYELTIY